jgi:CheY-like chemotaxis protein
VKTWSASLPFFCIINSSAWFPFALSPFSPFARSFKLPLPHAAKSHHLEWVIPVDSLSAKKIKSSPRGSAATLHKGKGRILVMDDDPGVRQVAGKILTHLGYEVDCAVDGAEAIDKYQAARKAGQPFDLVIMDLTIPGGMGGQEAIQNLLKIEPKTRAIVSSGYADDPIMTHYQEHGFAGVIKKPYKVSTFSHILHEVLGREEP